MAFFNNVISEDIGDAAVGVTENVRNNTEKKTGI